MHLLQSLCQEVGRRSRAVVSDIIVGISTCVACFHCVFFFLFNILSCVVLERPSPPVSVKVFNVESTAAAVEWHAPLFQGNTKNRIVYFVEYNSSLSSSFVRSPTQTDETTARISGLYPYVSYQFRVVARNDVDESSPSLPSVLVQTLPDSKLDKQ